MAARPEAEGGERPEGEEGQARPPASAWDRAAWAGLAVGAAARAVTLILHPPLDYVYSDMASYVSGAQHLVTGGPQGRLDAFFPSGMHLVLAIPLLVFGPGRSGLWAASLLWFALGSVTPWLAWRWTRRILNVPAAAITAILCAVWPLFVTQVGFFMSELPAMALLLGGLLVSSRVLAAERPARAAELLLLGALVGLGITVRPQLALNFALAVIPVAWLLRRRLVPLAALVLGLVIPIGLVMGVNSDATGRFTLLSENTGVNLFLAHCDGGAVIAYGPHSSYEIETPVYTQTHRGRMYIFQGHDIWDQSFFTHQAEDCIRHDGLGHIRLIGRHVLDLTVTSVPWPQYDDYQMRGIVKATNIAYGLLLPTVMVGTLLVFSRRQRGSRGPRLVLAHLLCLLPTVVVFLSEPRFRLPYDVFGLALLAALIARGLRPARLAAEGDPARGGAAGEPVPVTGHDPVAGPGDGLDR